MASTTKGTARGQRRNWRGIPPEQRDAMRREKLLDAGLDLFGRNGYARTAIEALCTAAGVATRSFYEHFESREDLLLAVYNRVVDEIAANMTAALEAEPTTAREHVRTGIAAFIETLMSDERKGRIAELEVIGVSPLVERRRREVIRLFAEMANSQLVRLMQAGLIPQQELGLTAITMAGGTTEVLVDLMSTPRRKRPPLAELIDELTRIYLAALGAS